MDFRVFGSKPYMLFVNENTMVKRKKETLVLQAFSKKPPCFQLTGVFWGSYGKIVLDTSLVYQDFHFLKGFLGFLSGALVQDPNGKPL